MKAKKYLIILILKYLEANSDEKHPLTQTRIAEEISEVFPCDRKTVGRNLRFLKEVGYPIKKTSRGVLSRQASVYGRRARICSERRRRGAGQDAGGKGRTFREAAFRAAPFAEVRYAVH